MREFLILLAVIICTLFLVFTNFGENRTVVYDCRETHKYPEFPVEVKHECIRLIEEWLKYEKENGPGLHENRRGLLTT